MSDEVVLSPKFCDPPPPTHPRKAEKKSLGRGGGFITYDGVTFFGFCVVNTKSYDHLWILPSTTLRSNFSEAADSLLCSDPGLDTTAICGNNFRYRFRFGLDFLF